LSLAEPEAAPPFSLHGAPALRRSSVRIPSAPPDKDRFYL
jgi:hypothetical protein